MTDYLKPIDDRTASIAQNRLSSLREPTEQEIQSGIDAAMRDTLRSPPYSPKFAPPAVAGERGSGWLPDRELGARPSSVLSGALADEWGPLAKGRGSWRHARMWLLRWELVSGEERERVTRLVGVEISEADAEWLFGVVADRVAKGEAEARERRG